MEHLLDKLTEKCAALQGYTVKTAARGVVARDFLRNHEGRSATALLMSLYNLFGSEVLFWEPETLWLTLERDEKIDLDVESRDKVLAAIALIRNPAFFWDSLVFQRTTQSLNGELYDPEALQECHPAHMAWALYEAAILRGMDPETGAVPELDEDVQQYAAVCLRRAGYVLPPTQLRAVGDNLEALLAKDAGDFIAEVKKSWEQVDKGALPYRKFQEDPLGVQLAQLASCYLYVQEQAERLAEDVLAIESGPTT